MRVNNPSGHVDTGPQRKQDDDQREYREEVGEVAGLVHGVESHVDELQHDAAHDEPSDEDSDDFVHSSSLYGTCFLLVTLS